MSSEYLDRPLFENARVCMSDLMNVQSSTNLQWVRKSHVPLSAVPVSVIWHLQSAVLTTTIVLGVDDRCSRERINDWLELSEMIFHLVRKPWRYFQKPEIIELCHPAKHRLGRASAYHSVLLSTMNWTESLSTCFSVGIVAVTVEVWSRRSRNKKYECLL